MFDLTIPLCIFTFLFIFLTTAFAPVLLLISPIRSIVSCALSVVGYVLSICVLVLGLLTSFVLAILFCQLMTTLLGCIPAGHFILQHLEKRIKAQSRSFRLEERKAAVLVRQHLEEIDKWDGANAQLMTEIRAAEAIIRKKVWNWEVVPERNPRSKTAGSTYFVHGPFSHRPLEAAEPSAWQLVRWWRGEEDPRVWAAKSKLAHQNGILSDKRTVLVRLEQENDELAARRDETIRKRDAVQWAPCQPKTTKDGWAQRQFGIMSRPVATRQPAPAQLQTGFFRHELDLTDEKIHCKLASPFLTVLEILRLMTFKYIDCEFCGKDGHRWTYQYQSFAAAEAAPFSRPCPIASIRPRLRPAFVSAGPVGAPSFFAPDSPAAPWGPLHNIPAPAPLFAAPSFPPLASHIPVQATVPHFSAPSVQASAPKASFLVANPPLFAPQASLTAFLAPSPAPPLAMSTDASAVFKTAPAASKEDSPPSALQTVRSGQSPTVSPSVSCGLGGNSLMSRSSFATASEAFAAATTGTLVQPSASLSS